MYFVNKIKDEYENVLLDIFIDMDGVVADFDFPNKLNFLDKRPIMTNINIVKELSKLSNVRLHILSICQTKKNKEEKNIWLDKYLPHIKNRNILVKDENPISSKELKSNFLLNYKTDRQIILIDDDNVIIKYVHKIVPNIIVYQDSSIID